jgi:hypothetical protein
MSKNVQFHIDVKNIEITSGMYYIHGIVDGHVGAAAFKTSFKGNIFNAPVQENESEYYAVTIWIESYKLNGDSHSVQDCPINLLGTFYLPDWENAAVVVSPESTIASIYTFARFTKVNDEGKATMTGSKRNMKIAYGMKQNLFQTEGGVADMIKNSPNGFETNSYSMFNSLCNLFYYCLTDTITTDGKNFYQQFLGYAWHEEGQQNSNFLQALRNVLYDPFENATEIYQLLADKKEIYEHSLLSMNVSDDKKSPDNWTLTLKSNTSGALNFLPAGTAYVVFDADDNAWVANNFRAGSGDSGTHCLVYKYDATPAEFSPVQGGGLLGVGFGVAIDPEKKHISFGSFGWGSELNNPQEGSISRFHYKDGRPISPSSGYNHGLSRVQGMNYDTSGNLWMASVGCQDPFAPAPDGPYKFDSEPSAVVVYLNGDPSEENVRVFNNFPIKRSSTAYPILPKTSYLKVFDVIPDNQGNAYVSCIGNYDKDNPDNCVLSAVYKVKLVQGELYCKGAWYSDFTSGNGEVGFESLRQVTLNAEGDVVVVGVKSSRATVLSSDLLEVKGYYDVNTNAPWGVKIDGKNTVFLANFGHETDLVSEKSLDMQGPFGVTMLRDPSDAKSAQLLTVPTGGDEVTLANGKPLYGLQTKPVFVDGERTGDSVRMECYQPIMRLTSTNIDGAGNLWCCNNWKPSALIDVADNPGGDGVVIFLGIAEPE